MTVASCPTRDDLEAFARGELPDDEIESVGDHVDVCDECESTVALLEQQSDTFVDKFRGPSAEAGVVDEPVFHDAVERIKAIGREPTHPLDSSIATDDAPPASRLREYRLLARLGAGGMGTVYKAVHTKLRRVVALKVLPVQHRRNAASISRFQREIEAVGKLDHPNVVRAFDAGEDGDMHYLVMELVEGVDLHTLVKQHGPLPVPDACEIIRQAALGLQHAHEHGLVHRDLKPSNLMLAISGERPVMASGGREPAGDSAIASSSSNQPAYAGGSPVAHVKILDLGLALLQGDPKQEREEITAAGQVMGTLDYMAPEQAGDSHGVDIRSDIYALGCTLYKLLSGRAPFSGESYNSIAKKLRGHAENAPPPVRETRPEVPEALADLIDGMLAKSPDDRPATPAEVAAALEPWCDGCDLPTLISQIDIPAQPDLDPASQAEIAMMLPMTKRAANNRGRRQLGIFAGVASLLLLLAAAAAIVIAIRRGDGPETAVEVPDGSRVKIDEQGNVAVALPDQGAAAGQQERTRNSAGGHESAVEGGGEGPVETAPATGQPVEGLAMSLSISPTHWKVGDEIEMTCSYHNTSDQPIDVPAWGVVFQAIAAEPIATLDGGGLAVGGDVSQVPGDPFARRLPAVFQREAFVTLLPGQSKTFNMRGRYDDVQRLNIYGPHGDSMWYRMPAGQYHVRALLNTTRQLHPNGLRGQDPQRGVVSLWEGQLKSGPVVVKTTDELVPKHQHLVPAKPAGGRGVEGFAIDLWCSSAHWRPGDEIVLGCVYHNMTNEPMFVPVWGVLPSAMEIGRPGKTAGSLHVESESANAGTTGIGEPLEPTRQAEGKRSLIYRDIFAEVPAGRNKTIYRRALLDENGQLTLRWQTGAEQTWRLQDGKLRLQALLDTAGHVSSLNRFAANLRGSKQFWQGKALSGAVEVTVNGISRPAGNTSPSPEKGSAPVSEGTAIMAVEGTLPNGALARLGSTAFTHGAWINSLAYLSDSRLLTAGEDRAVRLWDTSSGEELRLLQADCQIDTAADGKYLVSANGYSLDVWDTATWKRLHTVSCESGNRGVPRWINMATSRRVNLLAVAQGNSIVLRDVTDGSILRTLDLEEKPYTIAVSPDGTRLAATGGPSKTVSVWNAETGDVVDEFAAASDESRSLSFSPDGTVLAVATGAVFEKGTVVLRDFENHKVLHELPTSHLPIAFSPDGRALATLTDGYSSKVVLWNTETGKQDRVLADSLDPWFLKSLAFSPDGRALAVSHGPRTILLDIETGRPRPPTSLDNDPRKHVTLASAEAAESGAERPDKWYAERLTVRRRLEGLEPGQTVRLPDRRLLWCRGCREFVISDAETGEPLQELIKLDQGWIAQAFSVLPEVQQLVVAAWRPGRSKFLAIRHFDLSTGKHLVDHDVGSSQWSELGMAFSPNGETFVAVDRPTAFGKYRVRIFNVPLRKELHSVESLDQRFSSLAFSGDSNVLLVGAWDKTIRVWDVDSAQEVRRITTPYKQPFPSISPDHRFVLAGGPDRLIHVWDLATGNKVAQFDVQRAEPGSAIFSPDGKYFASCNTDETVLIWDAAAIVPDRFWANDREIVSGLFELAKSWDGEDAAPAYQAIWALATGGERGAYCCERSLPPAPVAGQIQHKRIDELIAQLDASPEKSVIDELLALDYLVVDKLEAALDTLKSAEAQRLARAVITMATYRRSETDDERGIARSIMALERRGDARAREILAKVAGGHPRAWYTRRANAALKRMAVLVKPTADQRVPRPETSAIGAGRLVPLQLPPGEPLIDPDLAAKLNRKVDIDLAQTPLAAAVEELGKKHGIDFDIDEPALTRAGLTQDLPINFQLSGVRLQKALSLMLAPHRLTWRPVKEGDPPDWSVKITAWDTEGTYATLFYPLGNLSAWRSQFERASLSSLISEPELHRDRKRSVEELLRHLVYPTTWVDAGGSCSVERFGNRLVVSNFDGGHREIGQLFDALRGLFGVVGSRMHSDI